MILKAIYIILDSRDDYIATNISISIRSLRMVIDVSDPTLFKK